jgi:hypothetical protein
MRRFCDRSNRSHHCSRITASVFDSDCVTPEMYKLDNRVIWIDFLGMTEEIVRTEEIDFDLNRL